MSVLSFRRVSNPATRPDDTQWPAAAEKVAAPPKDSRIFFLRLL